MKKNLIIWDDATNWLNSIKTLGDFDIETSSFDSIKFKQYSTIFILCELSQNDKGQPIKIQELYGIELAKKLRREGLNVPIIFTSFLSRKHIYANNPEREIIKSIGQDFLLLPVQPDKFRSAANAMRHLTQLELRDVQLFACNPDGIVNAKIHQIPGLVEKLQANGPTYVMQELETCIKEIHTAFQESYESYLSKFIKEFAEINTANINKAISNITDTAKELINVYKLKIGQASIRSDAKKPWKLLLLDDELDEESQIVKTLEANGVNVICTSTAVEATMALEDDDKLRGKISVILADYRLYEEDKDGMQVQQKTQGYTFLQDVGEKFYSKVMSAIVYSGMSRQFLLDNLNTFKIRTEKYSKIDFKLTDAGSNNYLVSRIIELGDKNYEALLALPLGNAGWRNHLHEYYLQYRNLPDYEIIERDICDHCTQWVEQFRNGKNPVTPMIKGDAFEKKIKDSDETTIEKFIAYYKTRRLAQYLYVYFENRRKLKIRNEIANILMPPDKSREKQKTIDGFFSQVLGLSVTEFPFGATIEELCWFEYDLGIKVLESYSRYRERFNECEKLIGDFISGDKMLAQHLKANNYYFIGKAGNEINFNAETCNPYIFDKMDFGFCIEWLEKEREQLNKYGTEEYLELIQQLKQKWN